MTLKKLLPYLFGAFVILFIHYFPKEVIETFGEASPWTSYLYMYGMGLIVFLTGIWVIISSRAIQFGRGRDSYWFKVLIGGYIFFAVFHFVWILAAINLPYYGGS